MVKLDFFYPRWGNEHVEWEEFLDRVVKEGYVGVEWFPLGEDTDPKQVLTLLKHYNLRYTIVTCVQKKTDSIQEYFSLLEAQLDYYGKLAEAYFAPLFISVQMGREYFAGVDVLKGLQLCERLEKHYGIEILQETHRNKWSYGLHTVAPMAIQYPQLKLTLDISHWYCVSESFLEDRQEELDRLLPHVKHVHARIGHSQGAQVPDVRKKIYRDIVAIHCAVWQRWIDLNKPEAQLTITTEFGPPPYLIPSGNKILDCERQWKQNLWIKNYLSRYLIT
ncbi:MAG: Xylose isomerase domain protein barrel [Sphingobacterium multivorum]|jgi:hypothetical protein|uniref:sugar phosphate isomerase/epimerase family protein n=1 Tax=Sphingobacterium sp. TaxID=341027 RepID=UPI002A515782|nr:Xylose isomerase domain protein barrel [Sphingobacterium multivorum]